MTPTLAWWRVHNLQPEEYIPWTLLPLSVQERVRANRSIVRDEGWIIYYPDPSDHKRDVLIGTRFKPQQARDIVATLRGEVQ